MKMLNAYACTDMILDEAKLLCWTLANELNNAIAESDSHGVIHPLCAMLQHVTQLMIGRGQCAKYVASELEVALERMEVHGVNLEVGDAIGRFVALVNESPSTPLLTLVNDTSVSVEEKEYLHERA